MWENLNDALNTHVIDRKWLTAAGSIVYCVDYSSQESVIG